MSDSRGVLDIEKQLGFRWEHGILRCRKESYKVPMVKNFLESIDALKHKWVATSPGRMREDPEFEDDCSDLYDEHASRLWPNPPADRSAWLIDAEDCTWKGLYPRNLTIGAQNDMYAGLKAFDCA